MGTSSIGDFPLPDYEALGGSRVTLGTHQLLNGMTIQVCTVNFVCAIFACMTFFVSYVANDVYTQLLLHDTLVSGWQQDYEIPYTIRA